MKLLWCCLVAALASAVSAAVDVEKTVKQVQNILQANVGLPRLSRDEIIQLLNDIRAEDAKSKSSSTEDSRENKTTPIPYRVEDNEINPATLFPDTKTNAAAYEKNVPTFPSRTTQKPPSTTKSSQSSVVVVLPYTPRDGSSLQELYTRPPRVKLVPVSQISTTPSPLLRTLEKLHKSLDNNNKLSKSNAQEKDDFPAELQRFLNAHGLKGKPGQDHFLLPLEGFKPLPPAKVVDGTVQLPENILLTYDLISAEPDNKPVPNKIPPTNFLYEPLRPEYPFELDTSSSETKKTVLPLDLPVRKTKSTLTSPKLNFEPIDYDAVKVIPLKEGLSPLDDAKLILEGDQNKRQAENVTTESASTQSETTTEISTSEPDNKSDDTPADSVSADTGASIADLEESFGGAAPEQPGDSELPPPRKNGFYWMVDWNSFLEVGDGDTKVNIRFEPKLGDPQMFIPVNVP